MWMNLLLLIGGLALILIGANGLTDGAASVAKRFRISDLVIGLTIVAFGTSAPELVISVLSSLQGSAEMAIGNVVGSNIFNVLMIIGCTALVLPIQVGQGTMSKEIPLVILSALVLTCFANDCILDGGSRDIISRIDGLVLLGFFLIFMRYTFAIARNGNEDGGEEQKVKELPAWKSALYIIGGLAGLILADNFCRRCQRYCPFIRCQRLYHRTYTGGRRYLLARTGNFRHGSLEKEPGHCHWKRHRQQPVQCILCIRM